MVASAVAALAPGVGLASGATTHRYTEHSRLVQLDGDTAVANLTGGPNGNQGTEIRFFRVQGSGLTGFFTEYNQHGSLFGPFTTSLSQRRASGLVYTGEATIAGGEGRYANADGRIVERCVAPTADPVMQCTRRVTVTY
jgi:hypothetical protein